MHNGFFMDRSETARLPSQWELNAVVLHHSQRFFNSVFLVIQRWEDPDKAFLGSLIALVGNVLWAQSPYVTRGPGEEEVYALAGALAASVGEKMGDAENEARWLAHEIVSRNERRFLDRHDELLERLQAELSDMEPFSPTPVAVNRWIWNRLFPGFPYDAGQAELQRAIRRYLEGRGDQ